jgi:hypothetical protein
MRSLHLEESRTSRSTALKASTLRLEAALRHNQKMVMIQLQGLPFVVSREVTKALELRGRQLVVVDSAGGSRWGTSRGAPDLRSLPSCRVSCS